MVFVGFVGHVHSQGWNINYVLAIQAESKERPDPDELQRIKGIGSSSYSQVE